MGENSNSIVDIHPVEYSENLMDANCIAADWNQFILQPQIFFIAEKIKIAHWAKKNCGRPQIELCEIEI